MSRYASPRGLSCFGPATRNDSQSFVRSYLVIGGWELSSTNQGDPVKRPEVVDIDLQKELDERVKTLTPLPSIYLPKVTIDNQAEVADEGLARLKSDLVDQSSEPSEIRLISFNLTSGPRLDALPERVQSSKATNTGEVSRRMVVRIPPDGGRVPTSWCDSLRTEVESPLRGVNPSGRRSSPHGLGLGGPNGLSPSRARPTRAKRSQP